MPRPDENHEATMTARSDFTAGWSLRLADPADQSVPEPVRSALPIPATVPGTVHTDLLAAGLIPDPYLDENEAALTWIGHAAWVYEREFEHDLVDGEHVVLAFDGLDTVATVTVNDVVVARTENMHRRYEVPIEHALRDGVNAVAVRFDSAWSFGEAERARIGDLPNAYPENPFNFLRKSACNFGWDWGPALVTAGIWRDVALVRHTGPRIRSVRPTLTVEAGTGRADFVVELDRVVADAVVVEASVGDAHAARRIEPGHFEVSVSIEVDDPELWWPAGFGEQPMYDAVVTIRSEQGDRHDAWGAPVAFRSLRLDTTPDADGTPFVFVVNDVPVPIRGVNWIPDDAFLPRVTAERVRERIRQATDAHVNLVRVWGGGVYESESFYRACDEAGVLVWQDFLFACAAYPEDERLAREVDAEARDNVARLMHHPSLVLWNGNNENIWGYEDWDWKAAIGDRTWGLGYYLDLLPTAVAETDPSRPYWPGSPYSGSLEIPPNDADHALTHIWDVWNQRDYLAYREWRSRFAAEFGWQAPPTWSTLVRAIHDEPDDARVAGDAHPPEGDRRRRQARAGPGAAPAHAAGDLADWHFATQLNQANAVRVGVEHFRSLRPRNMGTIVWQLNDCWPVISWSAVDGDGRRKPLWYALRAAHEPRLLTIQPRERRARARGGQRHARAVGRRRGRAARRVRRHRARRGDAHARGRRAGRADRSARTRARRAGCRDARAARRRVGRRARPLVLRRRPRPRPGRPRARARGRPRRRRRRALGRRGRVRARPLRVRRPHRARRRGRRPAHHPAARRASHDPRDRNPGGSRGRAPDGAGAAHRQRPRARLAGGHRVATRGAVTAPRTRSPRDQRPAFQSRSFSGLRMIQMRVTWSPRTSSTATLSMTPSSANASVRPSAVSCTDILICGRLAIWPTT